VKLPSGRSSSKGTRRHLGAFPLSLSVRYLAKTTRMTASTKSNRGFICLLLEGGLSTFLCPAEIHGARKCLLKISISVIPPSLSSLPTYQFFCFITLHGQFFLSIPVFWLKLSRLIRTLPHNFALIKPIRNYRN